MSSAYDDRVMYPEIEPFNTGFLKVSEIHTIYYEQCGNPDGIPVVYLHGGPGSDTGPRDRRYFDPKVYHVILFHQRGAGKSTPAFCTEDNTTWALVADMEKLREKVGVEKWLLFGGSWGSTLALAYAETHINHVLGVIIRGIFTNRKIELDWTYENNGAALIYPEEYLKFVELIPVEERGDITGAYHKRITGPDEEEAKKCATAWNRWELMLSAMKVTQEMLDKCADGHWNVAHATMETHYFINDGFFKPDSQLMDNANIIAESGVPVEIVQGRYDLVCPMKTAWELHNKIPQSVLHVIHSGHSVKEEGTGATEKLVEIMDKLKIVLQSKQ